MNLNKTQKRIIELLFLKKTASKKELANEMSLSQAALTLSSKPLVEEGFILVEGKKTNGRAGRNEELLSLNPNYGCFLGVDAKTTSITVTEMDFAGNLILDAKLFNDQEVLSCVEKECKKKNILGLNVTYRKNLSPDQHQTLIQKLNTLSIPQIHFINNVDALANVYYFLHQEEKNFLLVKYGPGLGSCIYVNGKPIMGKNGARSEIGHAYLFNGKKLEDVISFSALLHKEVDEIEGAEALYQDKEKLSIALNSLSLCLLDSDALLALDRIIFAGVLLSKQSVVEQISENIKNYEKDFPLEKISLYPDYSLLTKKKASLQAFMDWLV